MASTLPFAVEAQLPDGWRPVDPDRVGVPGVAFVAVHPESYDGFTANIMLSGDYRPSDVTLTTLAEESLSRLHREVTVRGVERTELHTHALAQVVRMRTTVGGMYRSLLQTHVYLELQPGGERRPVLDVAMTATVEQAPALGADLEAFVRTIRLDQPVLDADTLRAAAEADDPPAELKALAVAVREGRTSWEQLAAGRAAGLPEVQAIQSTVDEQARRLARSWRR